MHASNIEVSVSRINTLVEAGGPVVIVLIGMSVIGLSILLLKSWQFFALQLENRAFIDSAINAWKNNNTEAMYEILHHSKNPIAQVLEAATHACLQQNIDYNIAREEVIRVATLKLADVRSYLRVIEVIAALSPLLGLFGTVLGMIEAFHRLELAGTAVDPAVLSGGIWEALLTTAAGLAVAIPAIIALNWLEHRIENFKIAMEDAMTQVFTHKVSLN
ncbi:MAG: MotA/TolQ/ExbB proton channel family protein [Gammaproteobacteria bacterium]|nr:MotA/TolQ/ExbB proton channel family protein [Gammaproteobacteria bacterium]